MGRMPELEASLGKLRIRISEVKRKLHETSLVPDIDPAGGAIAADFDMTASLRKECSDILIVLQSVIERAASERSTPDSDFMRNLRDLKSEHSALVYELATCIPRLEMLGGDAIESRVSRAVEDVFEGQARAAYEILEPVRNKAGHFNDSEIEFEHALEWESSLRARYDLLTVKY